VGVAILLAASCHGNQSYAKRPISQLGLKGVALSDTSAFQTSHPRRPSFYLFALQYIIYTIYKSKYIKANVIEES